MTNADFESWLRSHFGRGQTQIDRAAFIARCAEAGHFITTGQLNHWLDGKPVPDWMTGVLPKIEAALAQNEPVAKVYSVPLALTKAEEKALQRTAKRAASTPDDLLRIVLRAAFEDECGIV